MDLCQLIEGVLLQGCRARNSIAWKGEGSATRGITSVTSADAAERDGEAAGDFALAGQMRSAKGGRRGLFEVPFRRSLAGCGTTQLVPKLHSDLTDSDGARTARRML